MPSADIPVVNSLAPTAAAPNTLAWTAVAGATEYLIYLDIPGNGIYGLMGRASSNSFADIGIPPDLSQTPPLVRTLFASVDNYPQAVSFHQQRRLFGSTKNNPQAVYGSRTGFFSNFSISSPIQDDDAVTFSIVGRMVSEVRQLIEVNKALVVLTSTGEWMVIGNNEGVLTPTGINPKQQAYWGASLIIPVIAGNSLIYVQSRASTVRDLRFQFESEGYEGRDLTLQASHLVEGYAITRMDYQQIPNSIVWCVRSDGALLGLTYLRELDTWGWHRHDTGQQDATSTQDVIEDVCVIPETTPPVPGQAIRGKEEDVPYFIVRRTINGSTKRYIERMASRSFQDYRLDAIFTDCTLTYNGINATSTTITLTAAAWTIADLITMTASANVFVVGDVGKGLLVAVTVSDGQGGFLNRVVRLAIENYISPTVVTGHMASAGEVLPGPDVPTELRNSAQAFWSKSVSTVTGLAALEGRTVAISANGVPLTGVVSGGALTLSTRYDVIHVGLPITSEIETLDLDSQQQEVRDQKKLVTSVSLLVANSRGFKAGPDRTHLFSQVPELGDALGTDVFSLTGGKLWTKTLEMRITSTWDKAGRVVIRQDQPLPLSILGLILNGSTGG